MNEVWYGVVTAVVFVLAGAVFGFNYVMLEMIP